MDELKQDTTEQQNLETTENKTIQEPTQQTAQANQQTESEGVEDHNWKAFREARKKDRAEREAAEKRAAEKEEEAAALKAAMEAAFSRTSPAPQQNYYSSEGFEPDES